MQVYGNQNYNIGNTSNGFESPGRYTNEQLVGMAAPQHIHELQWNLSSAPERRELLTSNNNHALMKHDSPVPSTSTVITGALYGALGGAMTGGAGGPLGVLGGAIFGGAIAASAVAFSDALSIDDSMPSNSGNTQNSSESSSGGNIPNGGSGIGPNHGEAYSISNGPFISGSFISGPFIVNRNNVQNGLFTF